MSELDGPEPPERLVIPPEGPFRYLYNAAKDSDVEHPSSNLFSNLILSSLIQDGVACLVLSETPPGHAENRRRIDHTYHIWNDDHDITIPILVKESKAPGKKKNVEEQMYDATVGSLTFYNLSHLYGLSTIGTTFRAWTAGPGGTVQPFDSFALKDPNGYLDIDSIDGTRIWNDLMNALVHAVPSIRGSVGERSDDMEVDDAPQFDPQGIPGILNPALGEENEAEGSSGWSMVEVKGARLDSKGNIAFTIKNTKWLTPGKNWEFRDGHWRVDVLSKRTTYYCTEIKGVAKPKKGKGKEKA